MRSAVLSLAVVLVVACSGGDDSGAPAPQSNRTTTALATTAAPTATPTTTDPPPAATTTTTTTPATTTVATTVAPPDPEVEAVIADFEQAVATSAAVKLDPASDEKLDQALLYRSGDIRDYLQQQILNWRALNFAMETNRDSPARATIYRSSIRLDGERATYEVCDVDSNLTVEIGGGPGGMDAIVDSTITARHFLITALLDDGIWKLDQSEQLAEYPGAVSCE